MSGAGLRAGDPVKIDLSTLPVAVRWAALVAMAALLAFGSLTPSLAPPSAQHADLWLHGLAYGSLTAVAVALFRRLAFCALGVFAYSAILEGLQALVPGRHPSWLDVVANAVGVTAVMLAVLCWRRFHRR